MRIQLFILILAQFKGLLVTTINLVQKLREYTSGRKAVLSIYDKNSKAKAAVTTAIQRVDVSKFSISFHNLMHLTFLTESTQSTLSIMQDEIKFSHCNFSHKIFMSRKMWRPSLLLLNY